MNRDNHIYNGEKCLKNYIHGIVDGIVLKGQEGEGGEWQQKRAILLFELRNVDNYI